MITQLPDITRLVDRLLEAGLVERSRTPMDRRLVLTTITEAGLRLLAAIDDPLLRLHHEQLGHLTRSELAELKPPSGQGPELCLNRAWPRSRASARAPDFFVPAACGLTPLFWTMSGSTSASRESGTKPTGDDKARDKAFSQARPAGIGRVVRGCLLLMSIFVTVTLPAVVAAAAIGLCRVLGARERSSQGDSTWSSLAIGLAYIAGQAAVARPAFPSVGVTDRIPWLALAATVLAVAEAVWALAPWVRLFGRSLFVDPEPRADARVSGQRG